ncbi:MAG: nucleotidyltransferase family protein, partial [Acidothermaceae bacterium]
MSSFAGLVLAAGAGRRFGGPKALVRFGDETLVERAARVLVAGGCRSPVDVVLGMRLSGALPEIEELRISWNLSWREGISSSLRHGLTLLESDHDASAVVVMLVDQPGIQPEAVARLIDAHRQGAVVAVAT